LAYQPIVEVKTGKVTHFEVLTRLRESKAFSNPFQFIEFGENVGLISEFDLKMVVKSMQVIRDMKEKNLKPILSVNLSGFSLSSKVFMDTLENLLVMNRDICPQLMFEITESAKIANKKVTNEYFKKLRNYGIMCCIDDFGTGEATFEYLRNLEVDIVKIDGSYISDEAIRSANGKALLSALGRLCQDLGVKVVGEKVEHLEAVNMLAECGIQYGQGYFYAKPSTDVEILKLVEIENKKATVTNINDWR
jgi:EAL domain-containing protein (putative c-di-GMP-specific phosphodiesterase class I)